MLSDTALLQRYAASRDADAFADLARRHAGLVYATCLRTLGNSADAEDVAQECFLELARKAASVRSSLPGYLHTLARNRALDARRSALRRQRRELQGSAATRTDRDDIAWEEISPHVDAAIARLADDLRTPLLLHYFENQSQSAIAQQLGADQSTISRRLAKAVEELRRHLTNAGVIAPAALPQLLSHSASATPVPASLTNSLSKLALAGPAPLPSASLLSSLLSAKVAMLASATLLLVGVVAFRSSKESPMIHAHAASAQPASQPAISYVGDGFTQDSFSLAMCAAARHYGLPADYATVAALSSNIAAPSVCTGESCTAWWQFYNNASQVDLVASSLGLNARKLDFAPFTGAYTDTANLQRQYRDRLPLIRVAFDKGELVALQSGWKPWLDERKTQLNPWCFWGFITEFPTAPSDLPLRGASLDGRSDNPIEFPDTVYAISPLAAPAGPEPLQLHLAVLRNAAQRIRGQAAPYHDPDGKNLYGLAAMDRWIAQMQTAPFCPDCKERSWSCARATALFVASGAQTMADYLHAAIPTFDPSVGPHLRSAADHYAAFHDLLQPAITGRNADGTPAAAGARYRDFMGDLAKQQTHAQILLQCKAHLASAANELEAAVELQKAHNAMVRRENGRVWIDGVPPLAWGRSGETTFCGALSAALQAAGPRRDYATLMGDSGLAFRVRWWRGNEKQPWCPSSPVGEFSPWDRYASESAGWSMRGVFKVGDPAVASVMEGYSAEVVASINAGRPVLAYMGNLDMSVIYGYTGPEDQPQFLVRDYYHGDQETLLPLSQNKGLLMFLEERGTAPSQRQAVIDGMKRAVADWERPGEEHPTDRNGKYHFGAEAYAQWIKDLLDVETMSEAVRGKLLHPNWWTRNCLKDARGAAAKYLREMTPLFEGREREALVRAADLYEKSCEALSSATGARIPREWTAEMRKREIEALQAAQEFDAEAIAQLRLVVAEDPRAGGVQGR